MTNPIFFLAPYDGASPTRRAMLVLRTDGRIEARVEAAALAVSPTGITPGTWNLLELAAQPGSAGMVRARLNGIEFVSTTADFTGGSEMTNFVEIDNPGFPAFDFDDVAVDDTRFPGEV